MLPAWLPSCLNGLYQWIYQFQTLITGIIAIAAAYLTFRVVREQIKQTSDLEELRRAREEAAARAALPLALSEVAEYSLQSIRSVEGLRKEQAGPERPRLPQLPVSSFSVFQDVARSADREIAKQIVELLSLIQVQHSRLKGLHEGQTQIEHNFLGAIIDAANVYCRVNVLFSYGRESHVINSLPSKEGLINAVHNARIFDPSHPIFAEIERRSEKQS